MAHYAFLDANNVVTQVIVGRDENDLAPGVTSWETYYGERMGQRCVRTSYSGSIRGKYAAIGDVYDESKDEFVAPEVSE